jgi:hypothetical protein
MLGPGEPGNARLIRPVIGSLFALALLGTACPIPAADMRVTPARQAERDGLRRQILAQELATEEQALARAEARLAERTAAKDSQGVREAEDARRIHARNLDALRAEIARTRPTLMRAALRRSVSGAASTESKSPLAGGGSDADRLRRTAARSHSASATETAPTTAAGPSPRWWDAYDAPASGTPHATNAWNVYQGGVTP